MQLIVILPAYGERDPFPRFQDRDPIKKGPYTPVNSELQLELESSIVSVELWSSQEGDYCSFLVLVEDPRWEEQGAQIWAEHLSSHGFSVIIPDLEGISKQALPTVLADLVEHFSSEESRQSWPGCKPGRTLGFLGFGLSSEPIFRGVDILHSRMRSEKEGSMREQNFVIVLVDPEESGESFTFRTPVDRTREHSHGDSLGSILVLRSRESSCRPESDDLIEDGRERFRIKISDFATLGHCELMGLARSDEFADMRKQCEQRCGPMSDQPDLGLLFASGWFFNEWIYSPGYIFYNDYVHPLVLTGEVTLDTWGSYLSKGIVQLNLSVIGGYVGVFNDDGFESTWISTFRPEIFFGQRSGKHLGFGPYLEIGHIGAREFLLGTGASLYWPVAPGHGGLFSDKVFTFSLGATMSVPEGPQLVAGIFAGFADFNTISHVQGMAGLRIEGRMGFGDSRDKMVVISFQGDISILVGMFAGVL